jgi:hypothetical protein
MARKLWASTFAAAAVLVAAGCGGAEEESSQGAAGASTDSGTEATSGNESAGTVTSASGDGDGDTQGDGDGDGDGEVPPEYLDLFASDHLPTFEITIPPASWDALQAAGEGSKVYEHASIRYGELVLDDVGIRLKGRASFQNLDGKASFKIKMHEFVSGQRLLGLRRLTLNNMTQDPSFAHERMAYYVLRAIGLDAPLCNSARVYVNEEYFGLYANVQSLDKTFVKDNYLDAPGNLYDTTNEVYFTDLDRSVEREQSGPEQELRFELETNDPPADIADLTQLIDANYNLDQQDGWWGEQLEAIVDVEQFLLTAAGQALIADWDGFFGARNNYKIYHELDRDRFIAYSWGLDQSFGMREDGYDDLNYCYDGSTSQRVNNLFFERCKVESECWDLYRSILSDATVTFDSLPLLAEIDAIHAQIADAVLEDMRSPWDYAAYSDGMDNMRDYVMQRGGIVSDQLANGCQ